MLTWRQDERSTIFPSLSGHHSRSLSIKGIARDMGDWAPRTWVPATMWPRDFWGNFNWCGMPVLSYFRPADFSKDLQNSKFVYRLSFKPFKKQNSGQGILILLTNVTTWISFYVALYLTSSCSCNDKKAPVYLLSHHNELHDAQNLVSLILKRN